VDPDPDLADPYRGLRDIVDDHLPGAHEACS
jgi:hypothetical protein